MKTTNAPKNSLTNKNRGFSLVEMLVVIAVIGIISAIAVPTLANAKGRAGEASHQRTATMIATMATNAMAAGNLEIPTASDVDGVIDLLMVGVNGTGTFDGTMFRIHGLAPEDRVEVVSMLNWHGGILSCVH